MTSEQTTATESIHPAVVAAREAVRQGWVPEPLTEDYQYRVMIGVLGSTHRTDNWAADVKLAIEEIERLHTYAVEERGGYPDDRDYVQGDDGEYYRVIKEGSRIEIRENGRSNVCHGYVLARCDVSDIPHSVEVHSARAIIAQDAS